MSNRFFAKKRIFSRNKILILALLFLSLFVYFYINKSVIKINTIDVDNFTNPKQTSEPSGTIENYKISNSTEPLKSIETSIEKVNGTIPISTSPSINIKKSKTVTNPTTPAEIKVSFTNPPKTTKEVENTITTPPSKLNSEKSYAELNCPTYVKSEDSLGYSGIEFAPYKTFKKGEVEFITIKITIDDPQNSTIYYRILEDLSSSSGSKYSEWSNNNEFKIKVRDDIPPQDFYRVMIWADDRDGYKCSGHPESNPIEFRYNIVP